MWKEDSVCLQVCPEEAVSTPGVLPATSTVFFSSSSSRFSSSSSPSQLSYTAVASRRNISRQRNSAPPSNTLSLLISLSQMQMCCTLLIASRPFRLEKMCLEECGQPKRKKSVKKSTIKSDKTCSCCGESFSPLEQKRCETLLSLIYDK